MALLEELVKHPKFADQIGYVSRMSKSADQIIHVTSIADKAESPSRNMRKFHNQGQTFYVVPENNKYFPSPPIVPKRFKSITEPLDYSLIREELDSVTKAQLT